MTFFLSHCFQTGFAAHSAFNGVKSLERESDFSSLASDEFSNTWSHNSAPQSFVIMSIVVTDVNTWKQCLLYFCEETEKGTCDKIKKRRKEERGRRNIK
jgi:hypothetical protein